jgi:hypothetical protein
MIKYNLKINPLKNKRVYAYDKSIYGTRMKRVYA